MKVVKVMDVAADLASLSGGTEVAEKSNKSRDGYSWAPRKAQRPDICQRIRQNQTFQNQRELKTMRS